MKGSDQEIRCVLVSVRGGQVLLPNASMAEVITIARPDPIAEAAPWLLGRVHWRGWELPVLSFARLAGLADEDAKPGAKIVVLKALGGNNRLPFFALLSQGFPRLVSVSRERLVAIADGEPPLGVLHRVMLNDSEALVPDLDTIEMLVDKALQRAR